MTNTTSKNGQPAAILSFTPSNYCMSSKSAGINAYVDVRFNGATEDQLVGLIREGVNRAYAREVARKAVEAKRKPPEKRSHMENQAIVLADKAKRDGRVIFEVKTWYGQPRLVVGAPPVKSEKDILREIMEDEGVSAKEAAVLWFKRMQANAEELDEDVDVVGHDVVTA